MKVVTDAKFQPVTIKIVLETQSEFDDFKETVRYCDSIPSILTKEGANCDYKAVKDMLRSIYRELDK
jgi:hypothetical protein